MLRDISHVEFRRFNLVQSMHQAEIIIQSFQLSDIVLHCFDQRRRERPLPACLAKRSQRDQRVSEFMT